MSGKGRGKNGRKIQQRRYVFGTRRKKEKDCYFQAGRRRRKIFLKRRTRALVREPL